MNYRKTSVAVVVIVTIFVLSLQLPLGPQHQLTNTFFEIISTKEVIAAVVGALALVAAARMAAIATLRTASEQRELERDNAVKQREFDERNASKQRALDLKKEALLEASIASLEMAQAIGDSFDDGATFESANKRFYSARSKVLKCLSIGSMEVVTAAQTLVLVAKGRFLELGPALLEIDNLKKVYDIRGEHQERLQSALDNAAAEASAAAQNKNFELAELVMQKFKSTSEAVRGIQQDRMKDISGIGQLRKTNIVKAMEHETYVEALAHEFIACVRKDVEADAPGDDSYLRLTRMGDAQLRELAEALQAHMSKPSAAAASGD